MRRNGRWDACGRNMGPIAAVQRWADALDSRRRQPITSKLQTIIGNAQMKSVWSPDTPYDDLGRLIDRQDVGWPQTRALIRRVQPRAYVELGKSESQRLLALSPRQRL